MPLDATGVQSESDIQGRQRPEEGSYHGIVESIDASQEKHDAVIAVLTVLAGNVPRQEGRQLHHMMFLDDDGGYTEQHLRFALATGVIKPGEKKEPNWHDAEGAQVIFGVEKRKSKKNDKLYVQVSNYGLDLWSLDNPDAPEIPRDHMAARIRSQRPIDGNGKAGKPDDGWGELM